MYGCSKAYAFPPPIKRRVLIFPKTNSEALCVPNLFNYCISRFFSLLTQIYSVCGKRLPYGEKTAHSPISGHSEDGSEHCSPASEHCPRPSEQGPQNLNINLNIAPRRLNIVGVGRFLAISGKTWGFSPQIWTLSPRSEHCFRRLKVNLNIALPIWTLF